MIPLEEARGYVMERVAPLEAVDVPLSAAAGLVLAADAVAAESVPPFANTAMDGFAVRAADTAGAPVTLDVVGTVGAGSVFDGHLGAGEAVRIMTGAPIPAGADAVVMVERTEARGSGVEIGVEVPEGNHIRGVGEDCTAGELLFGAGTVLRAGHLGVLASVGVHAVAAVRRPRVGVISTGDELVDEDRPLQSGEIRDSNRRTLLTLAAEAGAEPVDLGIAADDPEAIRTAFTNAAESCDAILSSGGVSMGEYDYVKVVLDEIGEMRWMQIAIKPAKPFAFGLVAGTPVFGLPGNPVSSMVSFELLARPAIARMRGLPAAPPATVAAIAGERFANPGDGKTHFTRVRGEPDEHGRWQVRAAGGQGSHQLTAMARADALAIVADGAVIEAGERIEVILLGD